jgi:hypothetical protein
LHVFLKLCLEQDLGDSEEIGVLRQDDKSDTISSITQCLK